MLFRSPHDTGTPHAAPVMILKAGDATAAIEVDRILGNQEVVAKPYGPQLARVPGMAGLTVLADGRIALLLNPLNLMLALDSGDAERRQSVNAQTSLSAPTLSFAAALVPQVVLAVPVAPAVEAVVVEVVTPSPAVEALTKPDPVGSVAEGAPPAGVEVPLLAVAPVASAAESAVSAPGVAERAAAVEGTVVDKVARVDVAAPPSAPVVTVVAVAPPKAAELAPMFTTPMRVPPVMPEPVAVPYTPTVLVVDDSLTVRKITSRLLEREGYKALTAKDGLDALQILADANPDVILLDIEMPRMDGFEFTKTIKADSRQSHIPIIMITSRTAEKHRSHAMELGVNEYVGKPYQDENLMALVAKYAGKPT